VTSLATAQLQDSTTLWRLSVQAEESTDSKETLWVSFREGKVIIGKVVIIHNTFAIRPPFSLHESIPIQEFSQTAAQY